MRVFIPKMYKKSIFDINYDYLKESNIKVLVFDLDNTLGLVDQTVCGNKTSDFINKLSNNFKIIVASNNKKNRVKKFTSNLNCDYVYKALKPTLKTYFYISRKYHVKGNNIGIIGDQIVTDIYMGNRCHMMTILVDPLGDKDLKVTKFNRYLENRIKKRIKFKKGEYYEKK